MLEKLTIENFQCHEKIEVDLAHPIVVLRGRTDSGKSSVLRALKWVCTNRPAGDAFIRDGSNSVRVKLELDGGIAVVRGKGKDGNEYSLDGKDYRAFGQDVPDEITAFLNISDVNFQGQHDSPYWLGLSPGQVSRELNALVNLDAMDRSLADVNARLRKANATAEVSAERLTAARTKRDELAWVAELDADLKVLEGQETYLRGITARIAQVASLLKEGERLDSRLRTLLGANQAAERAVAAGERLVELMGRAEKLQTMLDGITKLNEQSEVVGRQLAPAEAELERLTAGKCPVCGSERKSGKSG